MADLEKGKRSPPPSPKSAPSPTKEKHDDEEAASNAAPLTAPVSFSALFRFATSGELVLNGIGIASAVAAGTAQPLMTLLFGNLITAFVDFGRAIFAIQAGLPNAAADYAAAQASFRDVAAKDATYLVIIGIGMWLFTYLYMVIWVYTGEVNSKRVREQYLKAILRQDIAYFDKVGSGEVATRISSDTHLVQQGISEKVALVTQFIATFITGFVLAYSRSWRLALALSSIFPCIGIAGGVMNKFMTKFMQLKLQQVAEGGTIAEEVLSTIRTAHAFGTQTKLADQYSANSAATLAIMYRSAVVHGCGLGVFFFVIYGAYALAFYYGTSLILWGLADAGIVVNVFMAILIGSFSIAMLTPELQAINNAKAAAAKLFETIDRIPDIDSANPEGQKIDQVDGRITLHDVVFSYPARREVTVLKGVSMTFEAGKTAALVGASGSGKSTIVSLVERFYDPLSGVVKLDGIDLKELNIKWLRSQIGLVSQEPVLFATTIKGNVAHGLIGSKWENASEEEKFERIKQACVQSNADGFITNLPNGYDTLVGDRGFLLSGGQKQRIAIARAIVSDPKILLLDEATSALDTQSEGVVQNALEKAQKGRTTITIAHRLSTIKDADQIFVMGDGQILEQGTHNELLGNADGAYARLVQTQQLKERQPRAADAEEEEEDTSIMNEELAKQQEQKEIEENAKNEAPLGRTGTSRSLASEILAKRAAERGEEGEREYSLFYLFKRMGRINSSQWPYYLIALFCSGITGMVFPMFALIYGKAIQGFSLIDPAEVRLAGDRNALWFFLIAVVASAAIIFQNAFFSRSASHLTSRLRDLSFRALLRQDIEYFDNERNTAGSLAADLSGNPQKIEGLAGVTLGAIVQSTITLIGGMVVGLTAGPKLAAVGVACIPLVVSAGYIRLRVVVLKDQANKASHASSAQLAAEAAGSIRTVASLTREDDCLRIYSQSLEEPLRKSNRSSFISNGFYALSQSMVFWVIALVFWYGSLLVSSQEYDTNQFFVVLMATVFGAAQAGNIFNFVPDISSAKGAAEDVINLLDSVPEIDSESNQGKAITSTKGHIRLEDVHFRYPTRPAVRVLRGFDIDIEPGTFVALVGASGCGKSTIIQLIERFYDPTAGRVFLDGQVISELNVQSYRRQMSLVSQEPSLYAGTIRFNILLGATKPVEEVSEEEIIQACRDANILDFIQSLPDGFDTQVGGKGTQLSGGQKQRIAIARALIRNPKILLLDEATSALDSNSERVVQDALDRAAKGPGRTTVAIAHRLSTIQNADCIYFVKEGRVAEKGTHDELLALKGGYYEYVLLQTLSGQQH